MSDLHSLINSFLEEKTKDMATPSVIISCIICALGLIGNFIVISVILILNECKKSVTHWYILQLAIADSVFLLTLPFNIDELVKGGWMFPESMCKAKQTILFFNFYASILFLVMMSVDRYIAVCHTFSDSIQQTRKRNVTALISFTIWLISLFLCIPVMIFSFKEGYHPSCHCSFIFPTTVPSPSNFTQDCIDQDFVGEDLASCIRDRTNIVSHDGELHCLQPLSSAHIGKHLENITDEHLSTSQQQELYDLENIYGINSDENFDLGDNFFSFENELKTVPSLNSSALSEEVFVNEENIAKECHTWSQPIGWSVFVGFNFAAMFLLPLLVLSVTYGLIIKRLSSIRARTASTSSASSGGQLTTTTRRRKATTSSERNRHRITITCASLVICFVVCWLPFHVILLAKIRGIYLPIAQSYICVNLDTAGTLLAYLNSALNPLLYTFLSGDFMKRWRMITRSNTRWRSSTTHSREVRYTKRNDSSNVDTINVKIFSKTTSEAKLTSEVQHYKVITTASSDVIKKCNDSAPAATSSKCRTNNFEEKETVNME